MAKGRLIFMQWQWGELETMWACLHCYSVSPKSPLWGGWDFHFPGERECGFLWKKKVMHRPSMAILFLFRKDKWQMERWGAMDGLTTRLGHCFLLFQAWGEKHGHGQFHPPFSPVSWELHSASCDRVVLVWLPWAFLHAITSFYTMLVLVLLLFVFLISFMFSSKFLSQPTISAFCPSLTRGNGCLELNFHLVLNHDICISILISVLYSSEDSIQ